MAFSNGLKYVEKRFRSSLVKSSENLLKCAEFGYFCFGSLLLYLCAFTLFAAMIQSFSQLISSLSLGYTL